MIYLLAIALLLTGWKYADRIRQDGIRSTIRYSVAALGAGLLASILLGVAARVAMRLLAVGVGTPLRQTSNGTILVIVVFCGLGLVLSLPYTILLRDLFRRHSLLYAGLLTLVTLPPFIRTAAEDLHASAGDWRVIGGAIVITILMWVPYAILLEASFSWLLRLIRTDNFSSSSRIA